MNLADSLGQHCVFSISLRGRALAPRVVSTPAYVEDTTHRADWKFGLVRFYESEDFGGTSPFSRANQAVHKGLLLCQYIPLLLQLTQLLAQLAKLFPFVGRQPLGTFSFIPIGLLDPIPDRCLRWLEFVSQIRRCSSVSGQFDNLISELLWIWWT